MPSVDGTFEHMVIVWGMVSFVAHTSTRDIWPDMNKRKKKLIRLKELGCL